MLESSLEQRWDVESLLASGRPRCSQPACPPRCGSTWLAQHVGRGRAEARPSVEASPCLAQRLRVLELFYSMPSGKVVALTVPRVTRQPILALQKDARVDHWTLNAERLAGALAGVQV